MKTLVTGGAGFIGSHIVDLLIEKGFEVVIIDSLIGESKHVNEKAKMYQLDILDPQLEEVFEHEKPDYVFHLAAQIDVKQSMNDPVYDANINIIGTLLLLKICMKYNISKFIYSSSSAVYGTVGMSDSQEDLRVHPISFYGLSKSVSETYLQLFSQIYGLNYTILRYSNVYGDRQSFKSEGGVVPTFIHSLLNNQPPVILGSGLQTRDFIYVKDVAAANIAALSKADRQVLNISNFSSISINELCNELKLLMDKDLDPIYKRERPGDILHSLLNNEKAKQQLEWSPTYSLKEGLIKTIHYYKTT
ncbi:UDP-glucose 4-epimerase [Bacillus sp. FJAT-27231]|uniref:NAD-dependent epimerase/dehydratase family protein n=1 Tax=Bacillus sp. FJAT-27231 TaxID=1679168 RepID=UPI0006714BD8|nr:NAD-dependent epimerase/dehydratase family protein [Bacillus sp. FJAT-27231]KMY52973.1 UDP-glucose 4-epimerase [Bacillus sp. FJAT-27231]